MTAAVAWSSAPLALAITALFGATMAYVALVDLRSRRIPNAVTLPGIALAVAVAAPAGIEALISAVLGGVLALVLTGTMYVAGRGQFGMGDVKLAGFGGSVLGVAAVPAFIVTASLLASVAACVVLLRGGGWRSTMAYGPYLAAAAIALCCWSGPVAA